MVPYSSNSRKAQSGIHWGNQWFDTDWPSFLVFSTAKVALVDWGLSIYKGALFFDAAENHLVYIMLGNVSVFAGFDVKKASTAFLRMPMCCLLVMMADT